MTTDLVGTRLGEFEIVRELGRGGMGVVYEAVQTTLNRKVALKVLGPGLGLTVRAVERFRREAEAAAKLHHTNIVPVYATGEERGVHFYAMELIDGPSLDTVIRQRRQGDVPETATASPGPLAATGAYAPSASPGATSGTSATGSCAGWFDRAAAMIADVADALAHAHAQGVTHRDIKPSNLLLSADGRLSVTDFGLARMLEQPGMTVTGEFVGTPAYMSPEQITAGRIPVDHRTDLYSLGATLYELLTLRPPFVADGRDKLLAMVIQKEPPAPRSLDGRIPRDLETICLKCLEKDPDRRYSSAKELAEDLRRYVNRFAILARRAGAFTKFKKWAKRNPALSAAGLAIVLAVVAAGFFAWRADAEKERRLADERRRDQELIAERQQVALERGMTAALAADVRAVERAVEEAEQLGVPAGPIRLLRGLAAIYSGRSAEAIEHLDQAVRLLPESVTARALLAHACYEAVDWARAERALAAATALSARTPEEKLFLGQAIGHVRPTEGLALIDAALAERWSGIGLELRSRVRFAIAVQTETAADAEAALGDAEAARRLLPENPLPLCVSSQAHVQAAAAYRRAGKPDKWDEHLRAAYRDAEELGRFPGNFEAICSRYFVLVIRDGLDGTLDLTTEIRTARAASPVSFLAYADAYNQFALGRDADAERAAGDFPRDGLCAFVRVCSALGRPGGLSDARRAWHEFTGDNDTVVGRYENLQLLCAIDPTRIPDATRAIRAEPHRLSEKHGDPTDRDALLAYLESAAPEGIPPSRPTATANDRVRRANLIAWKRLGAGDRSGAEAAFREAYETMTFHRVGWWHARAILIRMRDPNWPRAITAKK